MGTLEEFEDLIWSVVSNSIKAHIGLVLPLEKADEGFKKMLTGETEGKIVVTTCLAVEVYFLRLLYASPR